MNASKHKKHFVEKTSTFTFQRKKKMPFKLFEFLELFMIGDFLITLTQPEKTGSICKICFCKLISFMIDLEDLFFIYRGNLSTNMKGFL